MRCQAELHPVTQRLCVVSDLCLEQEGSQKEWVMWTSAAASPVWAVILAALGAAAIGGKVNVPVAFICLLRGDMCKRAYTGRISVYRIHTVSTYGYHAQIRVSRSLKD